MAFSVGSVTAKLQAKTKDFENKLKSAGNSLDQLKNKTSKYDNKLAKVNNTSKGFNVTGGKMATLLKGGLVAGLAAATAGVIALAGGFTALTTVGLTTAGQLETAEIGLQTLLGSADEAGKTMDRIKREAARTPFELPGLTQATQLLTSITKDGDKSIDIILDIGEGLTAMGKGQAELDRIMINLQQIGAVGKASMVDIRQFAFAGIPIFEMLEKQTGLTGDALSDFISDGNVSFELLTEMFDKANDAGGQFFNAYENQAGSFEQLTSNMKDSFTIFASDFVKKTGLFDASKIAITSVIEGFNDLTGLLDYITTIDLTNTIFGQRVLQIINDLNPTLDRIKLILNDIYFGAIQPIANFITSNFSPAFDHLSNLFLDKLWPSLLNLLNTFLDLYDLIAPILIPTLQALGIMFAVVLYASIILVIETINALINVYNLLMETTVFVLETIISVWNFLVETFNRGLDTIKSVWIATTDFINADWATKAEMIGFALGNLVNIFFNGFNTVKNQAAQSFTNLKNNVNNRLQEILTFVSSMPGKVQEQFNKIKNYITNKTREGVNSAKNAFDEFKNIDLYQIGVNIINGLISGVSSKANDLKNTIGNMANSVSNGFKEALNIKSPSRVFQYYGNMITEGLKGGIKEGEPEVAMATNSLATTAVAPVANNTINQSNNINVNGSNRNPMQIAMEIEKWLARKNKLAIKGGVNI